MLVLPVIAALTIRLIQLLHGGDLLGLTEYDDGVYLGQAIRLVGGHLPYRDFVAVNPPGIMVLLSPAGLLSSIAGSDVGLATARLLTVAVDVTNVALVGCILRRRSRAAQLCGMTLLALYPGEISASHTVMLEPYVNLLCLIAMLALFDERGVRSGRWVPIAGAALGLACTVKLFALFPFLAIGGLLLATRRRDGARLVVAAVSTAAAVSAPFFVADPAAFVRQAVLDQVLRSSGRTPLWERLSSITGVSAWSPIGSRPGIALIAALTLTTGLVAMIVTSRRREPAPMTSIQSANVAVLLCTAVSLLWVGTYYYHYTAVIGPWVALTVALHLPTGLRSRRAGAVATASGVALLIFSLGAAAQASASAPGLATTLRREIPGGACIVADSVADTIIADRFELPHGCPDVVDPFGTTMDESGGATADFLTAATSQRIALDWERTFSRADYLILPSGPNGSIPMTAALWHYVGTHFELRANIQSAGTLVYARRSPG